MGFDTGEFGKLLFYKYTFFLKSKIKKYKLLNIFLDLTYDIIKNNENLLKLIKIIDIYPEIKGKFPNYLDNFNIVKFYFEKNF